MMIIGNSGILEKYTIYPATLCSFWGNISGPKINLFWVRFACNHSYGYAHNVIMGRITQTDSLTNVEKTWPQNSAFRMKYPG